LREKELREQEYAKKRQEELERQKVDILFYHRKENVEKLRKKRRDVK